LCESIEEIGFQKVNALVSDNAANMKGAWTLIKNKYPNICIYGCAGHGFNLLCKDITTKINVFQTILGDAKCVIQYFNNKHIPKAVLKSIQLDKNGKEIALLVPVETRWSSFCKSLESLIKNKDYLQMAVLDKRLIAQNVACIKKLVLNEDNFWCNVDRCFKVLKPIAVAINNLEGDTPSLAYIPLSFKNVKAEAERNLHYFNAREGRQILSFIESRMKTIVVTQFKI
jgi:hypothetical protein